MEIFKYDGVFFLQILCACFVLLFVYAYSYVGFKSSLAPACVIIVWFFPTLNKAYCIVLYCIVFYMRHNSFQISIEIIMCSYTNIFVKKIFLTVTEI